MHHDKQEPIPSVAISPNNLRHLRIIIDTRELLSILVNHIRYVRRIGVAMPLAELFERWDWQLWSRWDWQLFERWDWRLFERLDWWPWGR